MCFVSKISITIISLVLAFPNSMPNVQSPKTKTKSKSLSGVVYDTVGSVIVNAKISAFDRTVPNNKVYETVSDMNGEFKLMNLSPGMYTIRAEAPGFDVFIANSLMIASNKSLELNLRLNFKGSCYGEHAPGPLTDSDKAFFVRAILEHVFTIKDWPGPIDLLIESDVSLRADNIILPWVQNYLPPKMSFSSNSKVIEGYGAQKTHFYIAFSTIEAKGNCATVVLTHGVIQSKLSEGEGNLGNGAYIYEFRRMNTEWVGKYVGGWIS